MPDDVTPAAAPVATPAATPGTPPAWVSERVPEAFRADPNIVKYQSEEEFFKGHVNLAKMVGQKTEGLVKLPGKDATPEQIAEYRKAAGVPADPTGYTYDIPEDLRAFVSPEHAQALSPLFLKHGLTAAQASALVPDLAAHLQTLKAAAVKQIQADREAWKAEVGAATFERDVALGSALLNPDTDLGKRFDPDGEAAALLTQLGVLESAPLAKFLARIGRQFTEQGHVQADATGSLGQSAQTWINDFLSNPNHPARDEKHPQHKAALEQKRKMYEIVYGTAPVSEGGIVPRSR